MTSSPTQDFSSEILGSGPIPASKIGYFRARLASHVHQALLAVLARNERDKQLTKRELASRVHRKPEQITRWLSYPSNLTLDTVSDLFVGMGYAVDQMILVDLASGKKLALPNLNAGSNAGSSSDRAIIGGNVLSFERKQKEGSFAGVFAALDSPQASVGELSQRHVGLAEKNQLESRPWGKQA